MFGEFKQKIVKEYTFLTSILLLTVSLSIYATGFYISYKEQVSHIQMLAVEESEDLFYRINHDDLKEYMLNDDVPGSDDGYFNRIFVYGLDINHNIMFQHNSMEWSEDFMNKAISENLLEYNEKYFKFELVDNRHPKLFMTMRYPLIEQHKLLGEVYVGIEATHWAREQARTFAYLILFNLLARFFIRYISYKLANRAMVPVVQSFEQQKQFVANASHELRTPLSIIISGMEVLKSDEENKLSAFSQDVMRDINDEALKMKKLIDNLLLTARNDNDTLAVNPTVFSLNELLTKLYNKFSLLADRKNIEINLAPLNEISIYADSMHIEQILTILIDNAVKYTPENGMIDIGVKENKQHIIISVQDNGKGIAAEDLPHIFERFYRAEKSRTTYGNGLGLSIAQILARKNNGEITVTSKENEGSCFSLAMKKVYF
ncbi:HAMP domain-containing sensor histidine kinase [Megamonas hypermegale]|uniref:sensor histidine kinase n=1 Tax=Megamonas hypermegale TaxID=158847 RepID=UPI00320990CF